MEGICPPGEEIYEDTTGKVRCICQDGFTRARDSKCYQLYSAALCKDGQIVAEIDGTTKCVDSPCPSGQLPHFTYWPGDDSDEVTGPADIRCFPAEEDVMNCTGRIVVVGRRRNKTLKCETLDLASMSGSEKACLTLPLAVGKFQYATNYLDVLKGMDILCYSALYSFLWISTVIIPGIY